MYEEMCVDMLTHTKKFCKWWSTCLFSVLSIYISDISGGFIEKLYNSWLQQKAVQRVSKET